MAWLKRNLSLVASVVIALALTGLSGWFLYAQYQKDQAITEELEKTTQQLKTLVSRKPHPGTEQVDNIGAAKKEEERLLGILKQAKALFPQTTAAGTNPITGRYFKDHLNHELEALNNRASGGHITLPKNFAFTFDAQNAGVVFATNVVGPLDAQLTDIGRICNLVFNARPIEVEGIRRAPVADEEPDSRRFLTLHAVTNQWAVLSPYEITFDGFSDQLAAVLREFMKVGDSFVVRSVAVAHPSVAAAATDSGSATPTSTMASRAAAASSATRGGSAILEEKPLRITLGIDAVRFKPST